jgi:VanZ family protein
MKRIPFFIWLFILILSTSLPSKLIPEIRVLGVDKLFHMFLYSVLILLLFFGFGKKNRKFVVVFLLFAVINELWQYYIPGRVVNIYDALFNLSGVGLAFWVLS